MPGSERISGIAGRPGKSRRGQSSMEFLAMVSLSALLLAGLYGVMVSKQSEAMQFENRQTAEQVGEHVSFQVEMAMVQGDGYSLVFSVPDTIAGYNYTVELLDESAVVRWGNSSTILSSRYEGEELNVSTADTNIYRVVNENGEVELIEE